MTAVSIATKRLGTNEKPAKEEGGPQRGWLRSKTQILFLVQNVAYDNKFMIDYEVVKDQLPEEWHLVPTKPPILRK